MIEHSVRMPLFRAKYIAWLALESLCRQQGIDFEWELVCAEEQDDPEMFGQDAAMHYADRLKQVGCVKITYVPVENWIPLADKMVLLINNCSEESKVVMFQSADYYSSPFILRDQHKAFQDPKIDWFTCRPRTIFYEIGSGIAKMALNGTKGSGRGVKLSVARQVQDGGGRRRVCDQWFLKSYVRVLGHPLVEHVDHENWKHAFNTDGFNNCTLARTGWIRDGHNKWRDVPFDWKANIPSEILDRVAALKKYLPEHKRGIGKK